MSVAELAVFNEQILQQAKQKGEEEKAKLAASEDDAKKAAQTVKLAPHNLTAELQISIVTPTNVNRLQFLELCFYMVNYQTSTNILEWVVLDASPTPQEQARVKQHLKALEQQYPKAGAALRYLVYPPNNLRCIGAIRNYYNTMVRGDVVVCFDDDDFYPAERVQHVADTFVAHSNIHLVACSGLCIFDVDLGMIFKFREMHQNHGTNNTFAYTRLFGLTRRYNEEKCYGEEASFTNNFSEPMQQLNMYESLLNIAHASNTVNKRKNIMMNYLYPDSHRYITETDYQLCHFIKDPELLGLFQDKLQLNLPRAEWPQSTFDIVYYCGMSMPWQPTDTHLGGSEQAVKLLSEEWMRMGYSVAVYTTLNKGDHAGGDSLATDTQQVRNKDQGLVVHNGVHYFSYQQFKLKRRYKTVILWRPAGVQPFVKMGIACSTLLVDLHDNFTVNSESFLRMINNNIHRIDHIMVKSNFHKKCLELHAKKLNLNSDALQAKSVVMCNGVRIDEFATPCADPPLERERFRFCYTSCYTRGLRELMLYTWPIIKAGLPQAELHVYYGMDMVPDKNFIKEMHWLLKCDGVTDYGRVNKDVIIAEKQRANLHLYYTASPSETDCIAVRESLAAGCLPVISLFNVFAERDGLHISSPGINKETFQQIGHTLVNLLKDPHWVGYDDPDDPCLAAKLQENPAWEPELEKQRRLFRTSKTLVSWSNVAQGWRQHFKTPPPVSLHCS